MIETIKNIAAVVGAVLSTITLITLIVKPIRRGIVSFVHDKAGKSETDLQLAEIRKMLQDHIDYEKGFRDELWDSMSIATEFTEKQCRNIIKNIFYRYKGTKSLPLYEKKTLMDIEELYINRLHKNHWGQTLINEMKAWPVDYASDELAMLEDEK